MKNFKLITWCANMVKTIWNDMVQYTFNFHKNSRSFKFFWEYICVFEYVGTLHSFPQIYSNLPFYKMKWFFFFSNILPRVIFIICKNIMKGFQKFEIGQIQTCTSLKSIIKWHPNGVIIMCFHPKIFFDTIKYSSLSPMCPRGIQWLQSVGVKKVVMFVNFHIL
jgi:hypothetical protein